jgi:hypothetical protein
MQLNLRKGWFKSSNGYIWSIIETGVGTIIALTTLNFGLEDGNHPELEPAIW